MKLSKFYDLLASHDWFYMMSDSFSISSAGEREHANILKNMVTDKHEKLYKNYREYILGRAVGCDSYPEIPKPKRPEE